MCLNTETEKLQLRANSQTNTFNNLKNKYKMKKRNVQIAD